MVNPINCYSFEVSRILKKEKDFVLLSWLSSKNLVKQYNMTNSYKYHNLFFIPIIKLMRSRTDNGQPVSL